MTENSLQKIPQAGLLQQWIGVVAEIAHALLVAREGDQQAVEPGLGQRRNGVDHLLAGADHGQSAPTLDERLL